MSGRRRRLRVGAVIAGAGLWASVLAFGSAPAGAASIVNVAPTGVDSPSCGASGDECATITQALANVDPGGTINVAAGTYQERVLVTIPVSIVGEGAGLTVIEGAGKVGLPNLPAAGQVQIRSGGVTLQDVTVRNPGSNSATGATHFGIHIRTDADSGTTVAIDGVRVEGLGGGGNDYGIYCESVGNTADFVLSDSTLVDNDFNPLLLERCDGNVTVTGNTITKSVGPGSAVFVMNHSGTISNGDHLFAGNTITGGSLAYSAAFTGTTVGRFADITIDGNTLAGISLANRSNAADGNHGLYGQVAVTGNDLTGTGAGNGIALSGRIDGARIEGNTVQGYDTGVRVANGPVNADHWPTGTVATANRIVGNQAGLVNATTGGAVAAEDNWWGCNGGPGAAGCDSVSGTVDAEPWAVIGIDATPSEVGLDEDSDILAFVTTNSAGDSVPSTFPDGADVTFATNLGSVSPASTTLVDRSAAATFSSGTPGVATVSATLDNATVTTPVTVLAPPPTEPECVLVRLKVKLGFLGLQTIVICI